MDFMTLWPDWTCEVWWYVIYIDDSLDCSIHIYHTLDSLVYIEVLFNNSILYGLSLYDIMDGT